MKEDLLLYHGLRGAGMSGCPVWPAEAAGGKHFGLWRGPSLQAEDPAPQRHPTTSWHNFMMSLHS